MPRESPLNWESKLISLKIRPGKKALNIIETFWTRKKNDVAAGDADMLGSVLFGPIQSVLVIFLLRTFYRKCPTLLAHRLF
jgi:hypothetical protein